MYQEPGQLALERLEAKVKDLKEHLQKCCDALEGVNGNADTVIIALKHLDESNAECDWLIEQLDLLRQVAA